MYNLNYKFMKSAILYSEGIREYDLGHVLTGDRFDYFLQLFQSVLGGNPALEMIEPDYATEDDLKLVHSEEYIRRIERYESRDPHDTPLSPGLVRAARLLAGAGKIAGEIVYSGRYNKAFVIGGGVQHASRDHEKGFGVFSDVGICAENLMQNHGVKKILILDTDAHAGDGVYQIFCEDPRVLYISIHQDPRTLYPGTGFIDDSGEGRGKGYSVHIPLLPRTSDMAYKHVLENIFVPLAQEYQPEMIMMVDGSDPHFTDRITQMGLTLEGIRMIADMVRETADHVCGGKVIDFAGSGYSANPKVVALGWLASIAGLSGIEFEPEEPVPIPAGLGRDSRLKETQSITGVVKKYFSSYWKCFQ
jgi:acetoin utilization protein AcuC